MTTWTAHDLAGLDGRDEIDAASTRTGRGMVATVVSADARRSTLRLSAR
jgi:hypothetical protein